MTEIKCIYGDESFVVADYLAGRLSPAKVKAFEAHSFGCDRCFEELQRATGLRAADPFLRGKASRQTFPTSRSRWPLGALAAAIVAAIGIWVAQPLLISGSPSDPVYRDTGAGAPSLTLRISTDGDLVAIHWQPVQDADHYRVQIWNDAGDPVFQQDTDEASLTIPAARLPDVTVRQHYVRVVALDAMRQPLSRSDLVPL